MNTENNNDSTGAKRVLPAVLSLFDGMSCGQIALQRAGIKYDNYFASEIDKHAIKVALKNYPNTKQIGTVTEVKAIDLPQIELLLGGSPCQGFSFSGKQLNFDDPRSKLFFEFVRLIDECKPKYFLLENVVMKKEYEQVITKALGVEPIKINSALVSAQNRTRIYWTNIPNVCQPIDKLVGLADVLENNEMTSPAAIRGRKIYKDINTTQCLEVRATNRNKSNCLTTVAKDNVLTTMEIGKHPDAFTNKLPFRYYTPKEYCRLQTVPENYFDDCASDNQIRKMIGNGWTPDVIAHILSFIPQS
jgi:site-specific DNA-cytosine methylase